MRIPHGSRRSTPEPERSPRVRFSSVPPSTPLFTFSVLEWIPASGLRSHLYPKRATSLQRLDNNASTTSTEEERRDPRDRVVFETTTGTWACFRQLSCCGDFLILEDTDAIDVGPPRRHEYTWQQGPGRLPSVEDGNTSFGANGGWRQTLASVSQSVTEMDADAARHGTYVSRPAHHHREIALQDVHSVRRHVFKRPLPLTFNSSGHLVEASGTGGGQEESRSGRSRSTHHGSTADDLDSLEWRYELWGPVGVVFMLRGGAKLFLVFASGQHAERVEEVLIDFASGRGLQRRQRQAPMPNAVSATSNAQAPTNTAEATANHGAVSPLLSGMPGSPAVSYASLRLNSPEASFQAAPGSPFRSPGTSLALADNATHLSLSVAPLTSAASVVSTGTPSLSAQVTPPPTHRLLSGSGPTNTNSTNTSAGMLTSHSTPLSASTASSSRNSATLTFNVPSTGYLYCRPWGEAVRHRRYYLRPVSASPANTLIRLSRHRLQAWQMIRQTLGQEPRCLAMDLRLTYLTPSSTHENVFRVESVVDTYARYKDVVPLGGAVATAGRGNEAPAAMAARRRELELCRSRPIVFEALAKTKEERAEWLAWLQARGATVLHPEATDVSHAASSSSKDKRPAVQPIKASFQPLGQQLTPSSPFGNTSARELSTGNSVDRWVANCGLPSSSTDLTPPTDALRLVRQPQLPLRESDSERGSTSTSLQAKWLSNSPMRYPQPHPHTMRLPSLSLRNPSRLSRSSSSPDPIATGTAAAAAAAPHHADKRGSESDALHHRHSGNFDEGAIVVEDDERDARLQMEKALRAEALEQEREEEQQPDQNDKEQMQQQQSDKQPPSSSILSPSSPLPGPPEMLDETVKPSRRSGNSPQKRPDAATANNRATGCEDGKRGLLNGSNRGGGVSALRPLSLNSPGEEGATTDHTLTATDPTVVGAPPTPMYLEDTSSDDEDSPQRLTPSLSNTAPGISPHSQSPSVRSPSTLFQRNLDGDIAQGKRQTTNSFRSTPISTRSTDRKENVSFDSAAHRRAARKAEEEEEEPVAVAPAVMPTSVAQSVSDSLTLRRSATNLLPLNTQPDTDVYTSAARGGGGGSTPSRTANARTALNSATSSAVRGLRSTTVAPAAATAAMTAEVGNRDVLGSTPDVHSSQERKSTSPHLSPSPDAPRDAAPASALHVTKSPSVTFTNATTTVAAAASASARSSLHATPVRTTLLPPSDREDEAVQTREASSALSPSPPSASSLNGSLRQIKVISVTEDGSAEWSGLKNGAETVVSAFYPISSERRLDPRLTRFFTPSRHSDSDLDRSGEHTNGSPVGPRIISVSGGNKSGLRGGTYGNDSFAHSSTVKRSLRDSPLPPSLPPQVGSLTSSSRHDTPVDGGLRARAALTLVSEKNGSEGGGTPMLNSASSRATHRDSEHMNGSFPFQNREVMEQRKRAFHDSLFVNQQ